MTSKFKGKKPALDSDKTAKGSNAVMLRLALPWLAMIATIREGVGVSREPDPDPQRDTQLQTRKLFENIKGCHKD